MGSNFYFQLHFAHVNAYVHLEHMEEEGEGEGGGVPALTTHAARLTFAEI